MVENRAGARADAILFRKHNAMESSLAPDVPGWASNVNSDGLHGVEVDPSEQWPPQRLLPSTQRINKLLQPGRRCKVL